MDLHNANSFNHPMVKVKEAASEPCFANMISFNHPMVKVKALLADE